MVQKALYKRASFFIDVCNVLLYVDLFLYHEMRARIKTDACLQYYFGEKLPMVDLTPENDIWLIHEFSNKDHQNILEDWIDKDRFLESNAKVTYIPYLMTLYSDMLNNPICDQYVQVTEFGSALKLLMKDKSLKKLYLYVPFDSSVIFDNLGEMFLGHGTDRITVLTGEKTKKALPVVDSYVFENVRDVDGLLRVPHTSLTEVLIPTYNFNMVEDRTDIEKLVEQITFSRLNLKEEPHEYVDKYNLSLNTINVPI